jgi:hypothetical protein
MTGSQTTEPEREKEPTAEQNTEPADDVAELEESAAAGEAAVDAGDTNEPSGKRRLRKPTLTEASVVVGLVAGIVALVFKFAPDWQPLPDPDEINAAISDIKPRHPVTFKRFLQRQQLPIPPDMTPGFLARRGVMVEFHYEIVGASGKRLRLTWELSDAKTNELVAGEPSAYALTPSKNDDAGDWAIWVPAPRAGRTYYVTVTIFKPQGPPYQLKHFDTDDFPGFS